MIVIQLLSAFVSLCFIYFRSKISIMIDDTRWLQFLYQDDIYVTADMKANIESVVVKEQPKDPLIPVAKDPLIPVAKDPLIPADKIDTQVIETIHIPKLAVEPSRIRVLVLPGSAVLSAEDQSLFNNIFYNPKALALKEQEVKLIELSDYTKWKAEYVVSFGVSIPDQKQELYVPQRGTINVLQADSLAVIGKNVELKKELWKSLQTLFGK